MAAPEIERTLQELIRERPERARLFEALGLDYAGQGHQRLGEACAQRGLDPATILQVLHAHQSMRQVSGTDPRTMPLAELVGHIQQSFHRNFEEALPRLIDLVADAGHTDRLDQEATTQLQEICQRFGDELTDQMQTERQTIFPQIRELATIGGQVDYPYGSIGSAIRRIVREHDTTARLLLDLRELTDDFVFVPDDPPPWCRLLEALRELEERFHEYLYLEHQILFPRAIKAEQSASTREEDL
jgi:regulator of cell morphogenesis and NO signaling